MQRFLSLLQQILSSLILFYGGIRKLGEIGESVPAVKVEIPPYKKFS
jgi:hypothetical protein